jgi:integrase
MHTATEAPSAGARPSLNALASALPPRPRTLGELVDRYMAQSTGRDRARGARLAEWLALLGHDREFATLTDDECFEALEAIARMPAKRFSGRDAEGRRIFRPDGPRSAGTLNRYHASLSGVLTWAIRKRLAPKGFENPLRRVPRQREAPGVVRFLSEAERVRLFAAVRAARWPRLYLMVLLAITTGARRGELEQLRFADLDLSRALAYVGHTKNGDRKVLPLVPAVVAELAQLKGAGRSLVFASTRKPDVPYNFETPWRAALRAAHIRAFRFHDLRHTCASYLAQNGASLLEIADVMGHRQLAMVKRYAHLTTGSKSALVNRVLGGIGA